MADSRAPSVLLGTGNRADLYLSAMAGEYAGLRDGLRSVLVGIAGNASMGTGAAVRVADLGVPRAAYERVDTP